MDHLHFINKSVPEARRYFRIIADSNLRIVQRDRARGRSNRIQIAIHIKIFGNAVVDPGDMVPLAVVNILRAIQIDIS